MAAFASLGANASTLIGRPSSTDATPPNQTEAPADLSGKPTDWMFVTAPVDLADLEARRDRLYRELTLVLLQIESLRDAG